MRITQQILLLILTIYTTLAAGQNLVPNHSFEEFDTCPNNTTQIYYANGWGSYGGSPDYFNTCSTSIYASVPNNFTGFQYPADGNAYSGLIPYIEGLFLREFMGAQLLTPLVIGQKYNVSFKVSVTAHAQIGTCCIAIDKMGIKFSTVSYYVYPYNYTNTSALINNFANVYSTSIISDTTNWSTISGSFIADSAYKYIVIGNFFDDTHTDTFLIKNVVTDTTALKRSYYYIDDISVTRDSLSGISENNDGKEINLYPNPLKERISIDCINRQNLSLSICNIFGELVLKRELKEYKNEIDLSSLPTGIYIIKVTGSDWTVQKKLIKE